MNPLLTTKAETFRSGSDNLEFYHNRLIKLTNGVLLFCSGGEAEITIDLEKHHIIPNTNIMLLPGSILSLRSASPDFQIHYFAYSGEMMKVACFRLDPAFMHFMKENSCYTHTRLETIRPYDKVQRYFTKEQLEGGNRKGQLFKKFIHLVHTNCTMQRDVAFYAEQLCISTRYLSAITKEVGQISAKEIIDEFLTLEIKVALQSTNLSLKEIADRYNFPDQSFFGRYFKKHTGMSPKEYRAKRI